MMDERAQSIGIARFFLSLAVGAFVVMIVVAVTTPIFDNAATTGSDPRSVQGTEWMQTAVDYLPAVFLLIAFFGIIALSVFQREVLR